MRSLLRREERVHQRVQANKRGRCREQAMLPTRRPRWAAEPGYCACRFSDGHIRSIHVPAFGDRESGKEKRSDVADQDGGALWSRQEVARMDSPKRVAC